MNRTKEIEEIELEIVNLLFEYGTATRALIVNEISDIATSIEKREVIQKLKEIRFGVIKQVRKIEEILTTNKEKTMAEGGNKMKGIILRPETRNQAIKIMKKYKIVNEDGNYSIIHYNKIWSKWQLANIPSLGIIFTAKDNLAIWRKDKCAGIKEAQQHLKNIETAIKVLQELKAIGVPVKD